MSIDLSPEAITARLRLVSDLRDVCLALASHRLPVETKQYPHQDYAHQQPGCEVAEEKKRTP